MWGLSRDWAQVPAGSIISSARTTRTTTRTIDLLPTTPQLVTVVVVVVVEVRPWAEEAGG